MAPLGGSARWVEGHDDGADGDQRLIAQSPLEASPSEQDNAIALADPEREEARGKLLHQSAGLAEAECPPAPGLLNEEGRRVGLEPCGALPKLGDGPS